MLGSYLLSLLLTLLLEGGVALLLGFRTRRLVLVLALSNLITHLSLNYLILVLGQLGVDVSLLLVAVFELAVVWLEWRLMAFVFPEKRRRLLGNSVLANGLSFLVGVLLFWV